ncbi:hypothetical protein [Streptomyces sp. NPDC048636]|uniref:hypothetical protein n=1 Tax=Streptomyces sp. NPDC048636 TaxID=3155762 RepID=UPI00342BB19F
MRMQFSALKGRGILLAAALALLVAGTGAWWMMASSRPENAIDVPERVCEDRISGHGVTPLLPSRGEEFEERETGFTIKSLGGSCRLEAGGEDVIVVYLYGSGRYPRKHFPGETHKATLGEATGYLTREGEFSVYLPCTSSLKENTRGITIETSASIVRKAITSGGQLNKSTKGLKDLSTFTAQVIHDLAEDWYRCPGAGRLPDGPVAIHWEG